MPGSATLGTNLVDSLIPDVVDGLRDDLHPEFGVRQFSVFTVRRAWSGSGVGEGDFTDTESEITPQPLVEPYRTRFELEACGINEAGLVRLREVSLTYTEEELTGFIGENATGLEANEQWLYKLTDAQGQEIQTSYWVLKQRPFPDRIQDIGWVLELERAPDIGG